MSDTIRQLLMERQARRPIYLDTAASLGMDRAKGWDRFEEQVSPILGPEGGLSSLYEALIGHSMGRQILEQYMNGAERNIQQSLNQGDPSQLMRPMISSVMQLDR